MAARGNPVLSWTDGRRSLGGSVIRPPKDVWLEETPTTDDLEWFDVYQVYANLYRRVFAHLGGKTETFLDRLVGVARPGGAFRSKLKWAVRPATGVRLRAEYIFRDNVGRTSPRLAAHRLGDAHVKATGAVAADPLAGIPVGANGEGTIEVPVRFAVDPAVRIQLLFPWMNNGGLLDYVREDLAGFAPQVEVEPELAMEAFEEGFSDFLPRDPLDGWRFDARDVVEGDKGARVVTEIQVTAPTPGRTLMAVHLEELGGESSVVWSAPVALEATAEGDIFLRDDIGELEPPG